MASEFVPLPEVNAAEHGISFERLALPQGIHDEKILINTGSIQRIARLGGLGTIAVVGTGDRPYPIGANLGLYPEFHSVALGMGPTRLRDDLVGGVSVEPWVLHQFDDHSILADLGDAYHYAKTGLVLNNKQRDELVWGKSRDNRGLFDVRAHSDVLNEFMTVGLREAIAIRHRQKEAPSTDLAIAALALVGVIFVGKNQIEDVSIIAASVGIAGAVNFIKARRIQQRYGVPSVAAQRTFMKNVDRKIAARTLASATVLARPARA